MKVPGLCLLVFFLLVGCGSSDGNGDGDGGVDGNNGDGGRPPALVSGTGSGDAELSIYPGFTKTYAGAEVVVIIEVNDGANPELTFESEPKVKGTIKLQEGGDAVVGELLFGVTSDLSGQTIKISINAKGSDFDKSGKIEIDVVPTKPPQPPTFLIDMFVQHIVEKKADFGITVDTEWKEAGGLPGLVETPTSIQLSYDWEMGLSWHLAPAPDDWAEVYLRRRHTLKPEWAAKVKSVVQDPTIAEISPPDLPKR